MSSGNGNRKRNSKSNIYPECWKPGVAKSFRCRFIKVKNPHRPGKMMLKSVSVGTRKEVFDGKKIETETGLRKKDLIYSITTKRYSLKGRSDVSSRRGRTPKGTFTSAKAKQIPRARVKGR